MIKYLPQRTLTRIKCYSSLTNSFHPRKCGLSTMAAAQLASEEQSIINYTLLQSTSASYSHAFASSIQNFIINRDFPTGLALHCHSLKLGCCLDLFAQNILLNFYVKLKFLSDARKLFDEMLDRNVVSFVTLINGYSVSERCVEAVELFAMLHREGQELNPFVFTTILKVLVTMYQAELASCIHPCIYKLGHDNNAFVGAALIAAYSVSGLVDLGREVFERIIEKDIVLWSGMVACFAENGCFMEALRLFSEMRTTGINPNNFTFVSAIKACTVLESIVVGKSLHGYVIKTHYEMDPYVSFSLIDMYTEIGDVKIARQVFDESLKCDVIPWSFMIARYSQSAHCEEALELFCQMRKALIPPNQFTFASVLQACATSNAFDLGRQLHCIVLKVGLILDVFVSNALMDVYAKCGNMDNSVDLFMETSNRNEVSWNTIIVGHVQIGEGEKALHLFLDMIENSIHATEVTYSSVLRACASLAAFDTGTQVHGLTIKTLYEQEHAVGNALIDMYSKSGKIKEARIVFDTLNCQNIVSWNTIISAYSMHGIGSEALSLFEMMQKDNVKPNQLTFVGVLSACSNTGSLDQGQGYFTSMQEKYGIEPCIEHYTCMVSLLGKLGHLDKAINLIKDIPFKPSIMLWRALLGACAAQGDIELGRISAEHILEMDPQDEATYILLSNIYASSKRWDNVASIRKIMKKKHLKKEPGISWIEFQGTVHYFTVGDVSHPDIKLILGMLEWLNRKASGAAYVPNHSVILLDVEEDEKSRLLWVHTERLALAFGLVRIPSCIPIRIIKNLRICLDCHVVMKIVSKLTMREIVVRDVNRFHHFQDGVCSCGDYW